LFFCKTVQFQLFLSLHVKIKLKPIGVEECRARNCFWERPSNQDKQKERRPTTKQIIMKIVDRRNDNATLKLSNYYSKVMYIQLNYKLKRDVDRLESCD